MAAAQHARRDNDASTSSTSSPGRNKMLAAIHVLWHQLRPDLHHDKNVERDERLAFITEVLRLKRPVSSMRSLSVQQLGRILDELRRFEKQPQLVGYVPPAKPAPAPAATAAVIHLATSEQLYAIDKLFRFLDWSTEYREKFVEQKFNRRRAALLPTAKAHSLIRILLNVACSRELKARGHAAASREMIRAEIPALKARLGIDRGAGLAEGGGNAD
jgi:hypothetical protein